MSSFKVYGHEVKVGVVCVFFSSHVHFAGGEEVERQIKLVMYLLIKYIKQEKDKKG